MDYQFMGYGFTNSHLCAAVVLSSSCSSPLARSFSGAKPAPSPSAIVLDPSMTRAVLKHGSAREAETKLTERETRVEALRIRDLGLSERERFVAEWHIVQSRFLDHPRAAVTEADDLINATP